MGSDPVRITAAGSWFRPTDRGAGSLLRVADGVPAESVRRIRDIDIPGLLPIGNVVVERGGVWLRTPQPPGPTLGDLLGPVPGENVLTTDDAVAVLHAVCGVLWALHSRGLTHGRLDPHAVLLDPDGEPLLVLVEPGPGDPCDDAAGLCRLVGALARGWCDPAGAARIGPCADPARTAGVEAVRDALPRVPADPVRRRAAARAWDRAGLVGPAAGSPARDPGRVSPRRTRPAGPGR